MFGNDIFYTLPLCEEPENTGPDFVLSKLFDFAKTKLNQEYLSQMHSHFLLSSPVSAGH